MFTGPEKRFVYTGYGNFMASSNVNSIVVNVTGGRKILFDDGQTVLFENSTVAFVLNC